VNDQSAHDATLSVSQREAVHLLLSRVVGERKGRPNIYQLTRSTVGQFTVPPALPISEHVIRRERLSRADINRMWAIADVSTGLLDPSFIDQFIPEWTWPYFWRVIDMGPLRWAYSVEKLMKLWAVGAEIDQSRRQPMAAATVKTYVSSQARLGRQIVDLRHWAEMNHVALPEEFTQWTLDRLPIFRSGYEYGAVVSAPETKAPRLLHVRRSLHGLDTRVRALKARRSPNIKRAVRWRALLGVAASTGARSSTLAALTVEDFARDHRFPDGTIGPALHFTFIKSRPGVDRFQAIPELVADWISEHIAVYKLRPDEGLWGAGEREMMVTPGSLSASIATLMHHYAFEGDTDTYGCHDIRRVAERYARRYGDWWVREHEEELDHGSAIGLVADGQTLANLLTDHQLTGIDATYKDLFNASAIEHWSRVATLGVWEYVWGDRGARKIPDIDAIIRAHGALVDAHAGLAAAERARDELRLRRERLLAERSEALSESASRNEEPARTLLRMIAFSHEADEVADLLVGQAEKIASAIVAMDTASTRLTRAAELRIPVDDFASDEEIGAVFDRARALDVAAEDPPSEQVILRRTFTPREFAWATGVSEPQIRRYFRGESGFERMLDVNPDGTVRGVRRLSARRQWVSMDELPLNRYPVKIFERLQWLMYQPHGCQLPHEVEATPVNADLLT
jgi:integrase